MIEPVSFGHGPVLVEQKDAGDGILLQKLLRLKHAPAFFGG
jgi:hypothetical protein